MKLKKYIALLIYLINTTIIANQTNTTNFNFEPTVTKHEAQTIQHATNLSKTNLTQAIDFLETNIKKNSSAALNFALANLFFQSDKLDSAISNYQAALIKKPSFIRATQNLSQVYIKKQNFNEAFILLKEIYNRKNPTLNTLLSLGYVLIKKNKILAAQSYYLEAIKIFPDNSDAYLGLAKCYLIQKKYPETVQILKEILEINPSKKEIWLLLANCYIKKNELLEAISTLECANRLNCIDNSGLLTLADLYLSKNMTAKALSIFETTLQKNDINVKRLLKAIKGFCLKNEFKKAENLLKLTLNKTTKEISPALKKEINILKAKILINKKEFKKALPICQKLIKTDPLNGDFFIMAASIYEETSDFKRAKHHYQNALQIQKTKRAALIKLGQLEIQSKNLVQAISYFTQAQEIQFEKQIKKYISYLKQLVN